MSNFRIGSIFTQDTLQAVTEAVQEKKTDSNGGFDEKIDALKKFLRHGMSRFSVETLQYVLSHLDQLNSSDEEFRSGFRSLSEVREAVKMTILRQDKRHFVTSDVDALKYMETFFYCVYCLSEAKRLFELLYDDLYFSYYDHGEESRQNSHNVMKRRGSRDLTNGYHEMDQKDLYNQFGIWTLDQMTGSTKHKLKQTVYDMKSVLDRWTSLLTEEVPAADSFDPESEQDLLRLQGSQGMEAVLRLVPDMFAKYYKCMELAKQWWTIAHEIYPNLPFQRRPTDLDDPVRTPEDGSNTLDEVSLGSRSSRNETPASGDNVTESNYEVIETLNTIEVLRNEIEVLQWQEEKLEILVDTYNRVGSSIGKDQAILKQLRLDYEILKTKGIPGEIAKMDVEISSKERSIRLLEFQQTLLYEDYMIHLELRPNIIRFLEGAKMKLNEAQHSLTTMRNEDNPDPVQMANDADTSWYPSKNEPRQVHPSKVASAPTFDSEFSLQSIERNVNAVSDKCKKIEETNGCDIVTKKKHSLSQLNRRQRPNVHNDQSDTGDNVFFQRRKPLETHARTKVCEETRKMVLSKRRSFNSKSESETAEMNSTPQDRNNGQRVGFLDTNSTSTSTTTTTPTARDTSSAPGKRASHETAKSKRLTNKFSTGDLNNGSPKVIVNRKGQLATPNKSPSLPHKPKDETQPKRNVFNKRVESHSTEKSKHRVHNDNSSQRLPHEDKPKDERFESHAIETGKIQDHSSRSSVPHENKPKDSKQLKSKPVSNNIQDAAKLETKHEPKAKQKPLSTSPPVSVLTEPKSNVETRKNRKLTNGLRNTDINSRQTQQKQNESPRSIPENKISGNSVQSRPPTQTVESKQRPTKPTVKK